MKKLTKKELEKAIDFITKYDAEGINTDPNWGIYNTLYYGCPAYKDFKKKDIEEFLENNEEIKLKNLIK